MTESEFKETLDAYYLETAPDRRYRMLEKMEAESDDALNALRRALLERRFTPMKGGESDFADGYLLVMMRLLQTAEAGTRFSPRRQKQMAQWLETFLPPAVTAYKDAGVSEAFCECKNAVRRYIETCQSPDYKRKYFGLVSATKEEQMRFLKQDLRKMTTDLAERFHLETAYDFFYRAAKEAFAEFFPNEVGFDD